MTEPTPDCNPPNFTDVMIDIETLDTTPTACILSIGAVGFNQGPEVEQPVDYTFYVQVTIGSNLINQRTISEDTWAWWQEQDENLRENTLAPENPLNLEPTLIKLKTWFSLNTDLDLVRVWSNGAGFDQVILEDAYRQFGIEPPWNFRNSRCFRTVKNLYPKETKREFTGNRHNALADAEHQVRMMRHIMEEHPGFKFG